MRHGSTCKLLTLQLQLPCPHVEGMFILPSEPSSSQSCIGSIASFEQLSNICLIICQTT